MRILEVNKAYFPHIGGIETLVRRYAEDFKEHAEVDVLVCRDNRGKSVTEEIGSITVHRCSSLGTYFSCPLSFSFIREFRKMSKLADVIHINVPFPLADVACLLSGYKGRIVVSWHSDVVKQKRLLRLYKPILNRFLRRADVILAATQGHIDSSPHISQFREKCVILPYGLDIEEYLQSNSTPILTDKLKSKDSVKVLFAGRLVGYKGADVLLKAFRSTRNCELFIVGTGELENTLKEDAAQSGIADRIHFLGFLPDDALKAAFRDCDIFVLPSVANNEAFGIVQLEAMVCSKPVINTSLPTGVPHVSLHGETGITVQPGNASELANAIMSLVENPKLRAEFGKNALKRVIHCFDNKKILNDIFSILTGNKAMPSG